MLLRSRKTPLLAAGIALFLSLPAAYGQSTEYTTLEPDQDVFRTQRGRVNSMLASRTPAPLSDDDRLALEEFLTKYQFPAFTRTDPQSIGRLHEERTRFQTQFLWGPINGPIRQEVNRIVFAEAQKLIAGNFHPWVKFHAVLILSSIDQRKPVGFNAGAQSDPYPQATAALIQIVGDPELDDMLKVAAWYGLNRHVRNNLPGDADATKAAIRTAAQAQSAPQPDDDDGRLWIRLKSMEVLAALGNQQDLALIAPAVGDKATPLWFRLLVTSTLTQLELPAAYVQALPQAGAIGGLGLEVYQTAAATVPSDEDAMQAARSILASDLDALSQSLAAAKSKNAPAAGESLDAMQQHFNEAATRFRDFDNLVINPADWVAEINTQRDRLAELIPNR